MKVSYICVKTLMFFTNLLLLSCGAILTGLGIWALVGANPFARILSSSPPILDGVTAIISVGVVLFVIVFLGFYASAKESRFLHKMYFVAILILYVMELICSFLVLAYFAGIEDNIVDSITRYHSDSNETDVRRITEAWDSFQQTANCCGYNGYTDWDNNAHLISGVPQSCCKGSNSAEETSKCLVRDIRYLHTAGCKAKLSNYFWTVSGVGAAFLFVEFIAMLLSACLHQKIGRNKHHAEE